MSPTEQVAVMLPEAPASDIGNRAPPRHPARIHGLNQDATIKEITRAVTNVQTLRWSSWMLIQGGPGRRIIIKGKPLVQNVAQSGFPNSPLVLPNATKTIRQI